MDEAVLPGPIFEVSIGCPILHTIREAGFAYVLNGCIAGHGELPRNCAGGDFARYRVNRRKSVWVEAMASMTRADSLKGENWDSTFPRDCRPHGEVDYLANKSGRVSIYMISPDGTLTSAGEASSDSAMAVAVPSIAHRSSWG